VNQVEHKGIGLVDRAVLWAGFVYRLHPFHPDNIIR